MTFHLMKTWGTGIVHCCRHCLAAIVATQGDITRSNEFLQEYGLNVGRHKANLGDIEQYQCRHNWGILNNP